MFKLLLILIFIFPSSWLLELNNAFFRKCEFSNFAISRVHDYTVTDVVMEIEKVLINDRLQVSRVS